MKIKCSKYSNRTIIRSEQRQTCILNEAEAQMRRAMYGCTQEAKIYAYKALVRPYLEYACPHWIKSFWNPSVFRWSKSSAICVGVAFSVTIFGHFIILHKTTAIDFSRYFHLNTLATRSHSLTLNLLSSTINAFRHSFFVASPLLWNSMPFDILSQPAAPIFKYKLKHFLFCI